MTNYQYKNELITKSQEFADKLNRNNFIACVIDESLREYSVKISIGYEFNHLGYINLYYKPSKSSFSITFHELKDKSHLAKIEELWNGKKDTPTSSEIDNNLIHIYVDGSFINNRIGAAYIIIKDGKQIAEKSFEVLGDIFLPLRNVSGEIKAIESAINWCELYKINTVSIYYDYTGLENWACGRWKRNNSVTQAYYEFMISKKINIKWMKVKSHSNDYWNEKVDKLAKAAVK